MASINKVIIVGNLGRDPELKEYSNGLIANLSIATTRRYNGKDGQPVSETEWHRVVFFGRTAEICRDYLTKGSCVYVEGRLRNRKYQAQDGSDRSMTEILGETLQLLDRRNQDGQQSQQSQVKQSNYDSCLLYTSDAAETERV